MPIDRLHGYLGAVYCSPELIPPATWLPLVWGDDPPELSTDSVAQSVIGGVFKLAQEIANALAEATFEPLLPRSPGQGWTMSRKPGARVFSTAWLSTAMPGTC
jgi:yecA family protein